MLETGANLNEKPIHHVLYRKREEFITLIFHIRKHEILNRIMKAVQELIMISPSHVTTEKIIFIYEQAETANEITA